MSCSGPIFQMTATSRDAMETRGRLRMSQHLPNLLVALALLSASFLAEVRRFWAEANFLAEVRFWAEGNFLAGARFWVEVSRLLLVLEQEPNNPQTNLPK